MSKMRSLLRQALHVSMIILLIGLVPLDQAQSQPKYPDRAIDLIVPYSAGGGTDLSARVMTAYMSKKWGVPVNVINKPGGNTLPACLEVYSAKPDGYTLLQDGLGSGPMLEVVVKNLPFKIMDRTFIGIFTAVTMVILVPSNSPIRNLKDLEAEAKKAPGNFTWTSLGGAAAQDYTTRKFLKVIDVDVAKTKPIMSQGASQAVVLTAGGNVVMGLASTSGSLPAFKAGTVKAIAVTSKERHPDFPDVPTTAEQGYPLVDVQDRYGPSGPPGLPSYVSETWDKALREMVKDPEFISKLKGIGQVPYFLNGRETKERVIREIEDLKELWGLK